MAVPDDEGERARPGQDTWEAAAGHVGAPAPPPWNTGATPPSGDDGAAVDPTPQPTPHRPQEHAGPHDRARAIDAALWYPSEPAGGATHERHHPGHDDRFPPHRDPYGVKAWGSGSDAYSSAGRQTRSRSRYGRSYRSGQAYYRTRTASTSPHVTCGVLLVVGIATVGVAYPIFAMIAVGVALRSRRVSGSIRVPPARTWLAWGIAFAVLGATSITLIAVSAGTSSSGSSSSSDRTPSVPDVEKTVALGQPATVLDIVDPDVSTYVPVTVTVTAVRATTGKDDTAVAFTMCAGPSAIEPYLVSGGITLIPEQGEPIEPDPDADQAADLQQTLPAGQCLSGTDDFAVPRATPVSAVQYGIIQTITWPVPASTPGT